MASLPQSFITPIITLYRPYDPLAHHVTHQQRSCDAIPEYVSAAPLTK